MLSDVMLDIETLSTESNAAMIALAAVSFDIGEKFVDESNLFYTPIDIQSCFDVGLTANGDTLRWWLTRSDLDKARGVFDELAMPLPAALHMFAEWMRKLIFMGGRSMPQINVWGNGADFDIPIVRNAYRAVGSEAPFGKYNARCYRTIKSLRPNIRLKRKGTAHTAYSDVISQAYHLIEILHSD